MHYIARGVIGPRGNNYGSVGQYTFINEDNAGWPVWDGEHKATKYATALEAMEAAWKAKGPFFRMPSPETIEAVEVP